MAQLLRILAVASCAALPTTATSTSPNKPDVKAARQNAFGLFNSIHSAMRQWGSSVHHNGMSFYLATAPAGSVFYHGTYSQDRPESFEWLAFEIEHASQFARSWEPQDAPVPEPPEKEPSDEPLAEVLLWHQNSHQSPLSNPSDGHGLFSDGTPPQKPILNMEEDGDDYDDLPGMPPVLTEPVRGYLHTYRANRPLNLLYIDGQAAAKCLLGSLDSQDFLLLDYNSSFPRHFFGEFQRAGDLCTLADEWAFPAGGKIDGFIRMEAGFEIIYCDFSTSGGLDLASVQASHFVNETGVVDYHTYDFAFEWLRACAARFHGHPAGRLDIDWSSMVSAFAYPLNLSNPDWSRQDLPRVVNASREGRRGLHKRLREVVTQRGGRDMAEKGVVNWQGVADTIVTRFSERLWYMANSQLTADTLLTAIGTVIDPFISYTDYSPVAELLALDRCTQHHLDPMILRPATWTPEDHAIAAAMERVSYRICDALFSARDILRSNHTSAPGFQHPVEQAQLVIRQLTDELRWTSWRECGKCPSPDQICMIPMFPVGVADDYYSPSCRNITGIIDSLRHNMNYWGMNVF